MSMTANKVLDRAEELGMLDPKVIDELRRQVSESKFTVSAEAIVKVLVDKKHLTTFQAKKLVAEVTTEPEPEPPRRETASAAAKGKKSAADSVDDLLANFGSPSEPLTPTKPADEEEIVDLEAALPPPQPLKAEVKPLGSAKPTKPGGRPSITAEPAPAGKPSAWKTPAPGLTSLGPPASSPQPGLTPLGATPPPGLTPLGPVPPSGLTPLGSSPGLTPLGSPAASTSGFAPDRAAPPPVSPPTMPGLSPLPPPSAGLSSYGGSPAATVAPLGRSGGAGMADATGSFAPPPPPKEDKKARSKKLARGWDSPLLLIGGGGLGVLAIAFVVLYFALTKGTAQQLMAEANEKYSGGQYATAIGLYEKYVAKYPEATDVSLSRLRIRAARILQPYEGQDMNHALKTAERELPEMEKEESFDEVRGELESVLPAIADHFATSARTATDLKKMEDQVALAHAAMKLVNTASYLPTARREAQQGRIDGIMEKIRVAERTINQGKALGDAMKSVQDKLTAGDIKAAYDVRARLLQDYPTLQSHADVVKNTLAIALRERDLVTTTPQTQAAATDDPHLPTHRQMLLAHRGGESIDAADGSVAFLLIRGTVYAVNVADGKVAWQRPLGAQTRILPVPLSGGDVVVADQAHREVLRLAGSSGKVVWRQSFGESFSSPQPLGEHLFVTLESGRVVRLVAATGELDRAAQLPQAAPLAAAPVAAGPDSKGKLLYQPAEHSTIYALAADDTTGEPLSCRAAYYLGHPPGSIAVPPMVVVGYVFVFQNEGAASSLVHSLAVKKDGTLTPARDPVRLRGRVTIPPTSLRSRLIVVSDLGDILVADVDPGNSDSPINITAHKPGGLSQPTIGYPVISGSRLFVADTRLADYEIVATRQDLDSRESKFAGDAFVAPLQLFGDVLVHARQRNGAESVTVTGVHLSDNKSWQLALSAPIVGLNIYSQQKQFAAVNSDGDLFEVGSDASAEAVRDQPTSTAGGATVQSFGGALALPDSKSLLWSRSGKLWALQDVRPGGSIGRIALQADEGDKLSAPPASFDGGVLAPLSRGAVWLLDPATGAPLAGATPFQPDTMPGVKSRWLTPLAVDERQFVAIDSARKTIYLARREDKPTPFLAQSKVMEVDYEPAHAALLEKSLLVVARGAAEDEIVSLSLPSLQEIKRQKIAGRVGPRGLEAIGNQAFCQTSGGELFKISPALEISPLVTPENSLLAAAPLPTGNDLLFVAQNGQVLRMSGESNELRVVADAGQPLTGAVQLLGGRLLAGGVNGVLHVLPLAIAAKEEQP
jgi:hypothetical protein